MNWLASYFGIGLSVGVLALHILNKGCVSAFKYHHTDLRIENLTTYEILYPYGTDIGI